jgi:hypothetical protein
MANELKQLCVQLIMIKIKSIAMQTKGILQTVIFMSVVAAVTSCAATKEYSSKLFSPRDETIKDDQAKVHRFLELDSLQSESEGWVSTDIIMGRDTGNKTLALDKLAKVFPAVSVVKDTATASREEKTAPVMAETKPIPAAEQPMAKNYDPAEVRNKKTREK